MPTAQTGDRVTIHYIGTLENGYIFDSADEEQPLSFTIGQNEVFPALEAAVLGMQVGSAKNVEIPAAEAFGPHLKENFIRVSRQQFPAEREIKPGEKISLAFSDGEERIMRIIQVNESEVVLDGNHPLAGLDLTLALKLVTIDR